MVAADAGPQPGLPKLTLHAPRDLEGMLEGERLAPGANDVGRRVQGSYRLRRAFLRLVFGLGRPFSESAASPSSPVADGFSGLVC